jgi:aryl-alcohol dehydrogenase-like predicted oxidoreductase
MSVGVIGLGTGDEFWNGAIDDEAKIDLIRRAVGLGMTLIDTAEGYGDGRSEELVAKAVRGLRERVVLATKFSPQHHSAAAVTRALEASLRRLETDRVDLYQLHWPNPRVPLAETMGALAALVRAGKARAVGVSNMSPREMVEAQAALGATPLTSLQTEYNVIERSVEQNGTLASCAERGLSVLAYSPLDQGQIATWPRRGRETLTAIAARRGRSLAQIALRWVVHRRHVLALCRTTRPAHLEADAAVMDFDLDPAEVAAIDDAFPYRVVSVPADRIRVSAHGEWNHAVYRTLDEALANRHGFVPSPLDLAEAVRKGDFLKPVRVVAARPATDAYDYELVGGRIRYWAWVIAHGARASVCAYVRGGATEDEA